MRPRGSLSLVLGGFGRLIFFRSVDLPPQFSKWIVVLVDDSFLQWDYSVIGDGDVLRADIGAALGDVAVSDAVITLQLRSTILCV